MGKSYTPKYRVEYRDNTMVLPGGVPTMYPGKLSWPSNLGKPNNVKAEEMRKKLNESFQPGGVNEHIAGKNAVSGVPFITHVYKLWVIEQKTGLRVAEANMPSFEVV